METALYILIALLLLGIVLYFNLLNKKKGVESSLALSAQQLEHEKTARDEAKAALDALTGQMDALKEELMSLRTENASLQTSLEKERENTSNEAQQRERQFNEQLKTVQERFANLANDVLEKTEKRLKDDNQESMSTITAPLRENLIKLQEAIDKTNTETAKSTASLSQQLRQMAEQTEKIDKTATRLTNVMRGGNQEQGKWGERILTEILEMAGLREGTDYDVQVILRDEKGHALTNAETNTQMKPDVVVHYPNNEDVIIDSKMSIDAYYKYVNTTDENLKKQFADELVRSVKNNVKLLAQKNYSDYVVPPRHTIDFVIMFVPNDGALQLAFQTEKSLWAEAFEKRIFITGQQNLMAILKMIQMAWRQYQQTQNQQKIFGLAEELLKRVGEFYQKFKKMDDQITALRGSYDEVSKKVWTGRQSINQKASQLIDLGVKENPKYRVSDAAEALPENLPETATEE